MTNKPPGQIAYETDCEREPKYHDKKPRKPWSDLPDYARESWERNPTPRWPAIEQELERADYDRLPDNPRKLVIVTMPNGTFSLAYRDAGTNLCGIRTARHRDTVDAWTREAIENGLGIERHTIERQHVLPGAEKATDATIAQRRADAPLRPKAIQRPCDAGLFGDDARQIDLLDRITQQGAAL